MMNYPVDLIEKYNDFMEIDSDSLNQFEIYAQTLAKWNEVMNLTAIKEPEEVVIKHFLDSMTIFKCVEFKQGAKVIDVGTGAGFPGVVMKIVRPDIDLTLLDSLNKRINFLKALSDELEIKSECIHSRAENGGKNPAMREKFDYAVARAVANLRDLSEYCIPFVKVGGYFVSMKGPDIESELDEAKNAIKILGGKVEKVENLVLPDESRRTVVVIKKIKETPCQYPRPSAKMAKKPL